MELTLTNNFPTLCLNMIVKNESKVILRLLSSVRQIIDTYCICDTGSTDNTVELIQNYFNQYNIQGKIISEPFQNFAFNRNVAFNHAKNQKELEETGNIVKKKRILGEEHLDKPEYPYVVDDIKVEDVLPRIEVRLAMFGFAMTGSFYPKINAKAMA